MQNQYHKIIIPARPQPDTLVAIFLLKTFGQEHYPGIEQASVEVLAQLSKEQNPESLEKEGVFLLDIGGGAFDHHNTNKTASLLVAEALNIASVPALSKLLAYTERDDKYGMGTISQDPLDKAFGLSGMITALNKAIPQKPNEVAEYILPLITAHYIEEKKRTEDLPKEFQEKLANNKAIETKVKHKGKNIIIVSIESDSPSMAGWLRSSAGRRADVVIQKTQEGYVNIVTRQLKKIDLREVASLLRSKEAVARNITLQTKDLTVAGRIPEIPDWYYDRATNSILNGGTSPQGVTPTSLTLEQIREIVETGLSATTQVPR